MPFDNNNMFTLFLISFPAASSSSTSKVTNNGLFPGQNSFEDKNLQFSIHYNSHVFELTINNRSTIGEKKLVG
jgi:hypothetical protein